MERERLNGRYCGMAAPGPIESEMEAVGLKVILRTDHEHVHSGFEVRYQFKKKENVFRSELITFMLIMKVTFANNHDSKSINKL